MAVTSATVSLLDGNTFVVSDRRGDIDASPNEPQGLFAWDTRHLSRWLLTIDGQPLSALSTDDLHYFSAQFFLILGTGTVYVNATCSVVRKRAVGDGFHEELTIFNHSKDPVDLDVRIEAAADFADAFEVKDALAKKGERYHRLEDGRLVLGYRRARFVRETWISADADAVEYDASGLRFRLHLDAHGTWTTGIAVVAANTAVGMRRVTKYSSADAVARPDMSENFDEWLAAEPRLLSDWQPLEQIY